MKHAAKVIGVVLILLGVFLVLDGIMLHLPALGAPMRWIGWGAWGVAFGAGFLVWAHRAPKTPA